MGLLRDVMGTQSWRLRKACKSSLTIVLGLRGANSMSTSKDFGEGGVTSPTYSQ